MNTVFLSRSWRSVGKQSFPITGFLAVKWLDAKPEMAIEVHFEGELQEYWDNQYHHINHINYNTVIAVPYDMYVSGYDNEGVSVLRLWSAKSPSFDMALFNQGEYAKALGQNSIAKCIQRYYIQTITTLKANR